MLAALQQKFRSWLFRPKIESGTVTLNQRRIFILPTRQGIFFAFVLLLMLVGNINYNLSLGYVLTFLLGATAVATMLHAFRNMVQLEVRAGHPDAVFAGDVAQFVFHFHNHGRLPRYHLTLHDGNAHQVTFDIPAQQSVAVKLPVPTVQRGWLDSGRLTLYTEFPLGLFHAWSYLHFDTRCLVYPKPAAPLPLPDSPAQDGAGALNVAGDEDFAGLRSYVAGDSLPRIAWKALAREQGLQVKKFSAQQGHLLWLDWAALPQLASERRLEVLTRWVLDADAQGLRYGLRLPGVELPPAHGVSHRAECLRALALYERSSAARRIQHSRGAARRAPAAPVIYGLLACILLVSVPHAGHLPPWLVMLSATLLGWRAYLAYRASPLPPRWLLLTLTLASVAGIFISFHTLFGREAGVALLILLATLKLLELRAARDATVVIYLACFIIITTFFYSQSIPTALLMLATLLVILTTWVHLQTETLTLRPRLRIAATLLAQAIPLALILFVLFPRVQGPLWGLPQDAYASSGLGDTMSPGSISKLSLSQAVAFRVAFTGQPPLREQMYWRGPVLWDFDGRAWTPGKPLRVNQAHLDSLGNAVDYTVTLEPHHKKWLFTLEMPTQLSIPSGLTYDFQVLQQAPVNARLRYTAHSQLAYRANAEEDPYQLHRALMLPPNLNPRARQLATGWRASLENEDAVIREAITRFNREKFSYTLQPPPLGIHAVDDFLFETRLGFCEHYASSFVFLMRAAGIPARVVTGYQGAEFNDLGGYYIVRQSDAHAWAEVWLSGRGWVRIDPTAAISPARVQNGLAAALPDSAELPFIARTQSPWLIKLRFNLDALANQWNQWVLGYNQERQFAFLTRLGVEDITWQKMALSMGAGVALLIGLFALLMLRRLAVRNNDVAQQLYLKFCRKLEKKGIARSAHEGAQDFAARAAQAKPRLAPAIADITARYVALRYGKKVDSDALRGLRRAVAAFKL